MQHTIEIHNGVSRHPNYRLSAPIELTVGADEHLAIVGRNASGKSMLVDIIIGKYRLGPNQLKYDFSPSVLPMAYQNIKYISFRDSYGDGDANYYYQQRWNSQDADESPSVASLLPSCENEALREHLFELFQFHSLLDKAVVLLSSGELRKLQLVRTLLSNPRILIMDNPFIGLDVDTRAQLKSLLERLVRSTCLQVILVLSQSDDIPSFITHVLSVENGVCGVKCTLQAYLAQVHPVPLQCLPEEQRLRLLQKSSKATLESEEVVRLNRVSIRYGERTILKELDWVVRRGEHWALTGENGAGKSTLLSLVCADNPQSYACDISLFGRKRGTGESIWEIKKHIGYVSPEMHRAYLKSYPAIEIVASGLYDTIGLYRKTNEADRSVCEFWMDVFGIRHLADCNYLQLSSGEQRLVLLARAFVKDPELLILDEPMHGLDLYNCQLVREIIDTFCSHPSKTLIMVTHYEEELPTVIDHRLFLKKNR